MTGRVRTFGRGLSRLALALSLFVTLVMVLGAAPAVAQEITHYDVWVGGEQVTSDNLEGDGWSFTPSEDENPDTLTLDGFQNADGYPSGNERYAIYTKQDLTIELAADSKNDLVKTDDSQYWYGIYATDEANNLTITGAGELNVAEGYNLGITTSGVDVTITDSAEVTINKVTQNSINIYEGDLTISGGAEVSSISPSGTGIGVSGMITIDNATVSTTGSNIGITSSSDIEINESIVTVSASETDSNNFNYGIQTANNSNLTITNSQVTSSSGINIQGDIEINSSKVESTGGYASISTGSTITISGESTVTTAKCNYGIWGSTITIEGGEVTAEGNTAGIYNIWNGLIEINGGEVWASGNNGIGVSFASPDGGEVTVGEGTESFVAEGIASAFSANALVKNAIAGVGWTDPDDDDTKEDIGKNTEEGRKLSQYKKAQFPGNLTHTVKAVADPDEGGTAGPEEEAYKGDEVTLTATPNNGYKFVGWTLDTETDAKIENPSEPTTTLTVGKKDATAFARFEKEEPKTYKVSVSKATGGTVAADKETAQVGETVKVTTKADKGYKLVSVAVKDTDGKDVEVKGGSFAMPASDVTVSATFEKEGEPTPSTHAVTLDGGSNATASGGAKEQSVKDGDAMAAVTFTAKDGYKFPATSDLYKTTSGVTVARTSDTVVKVSGTPTADVKITVPDAVADSKPTAKFTVTLTGGANADVDGAKEQTVEQGSAMVTVVYMANEGFHFDSFDPIKSNGVSATFKGGNVVVSGTPTADVKITVPDARADTKTDDGPASGEPRVTYAAHVAGPGWLPYVSDGETAGTTGEFRRMEALKVKLEGAPVSGTIEYRAHRKTTGWEDSYVADDAVAGTTGEYRRIEAVQMRLTGQMAELYDVWYRVHTETYGWLGWARNDSPAGTTGLFKRAEAIEVKVLPKGSAAPGDEYGSFVTSDGVAPDQETSHHLVSVQAHTKTFGWMDPVYDGATAGTTGQFRRLEALSIELCDEAGPGSIEYCSHLKTFGWDDDYVKDGEIAGTTGEFRRMEAVRIRLKGEVSKKYDVWYRVHTRTYGWLGWACNDEPAGTTGLFKRAEAVQVLLLPKGSPAPGPTDTALITS